MILFSEQYKEHLARTFPDYEFCFHDVLQSTQDECLKMYQSDPTKKWVVLANEQTQGKGRYGRTWTSPSGVNLYVSFIDENPFGKEIAYLNLFYGVLLFETVSSILESYENQLTLKWPNDLYFNDKKLSGILFQSLENTLGKLIAGIGINVYAQKEQIPEIATSLLLQKNDLPQTTRCILLEKLLFHVQNKHRKKYAQEPRLLLDRFWVCSHLTQKQNYLYSSHFYSYKGILDKIHPDGTVDILTQDEQRIHLKT